MSYDFSKIDVLTAPYEIRPIPANTVQIMWPEVEPHLKNWLATTEGESTLEGVKSRCLLGHNQLWAALDGDKVDGFALTQIVQYDTMTGWRIAGIAGRHFAKWEAGFDKLMTDWARRFGCSRLEGVGRKGWNRRLQKYGYMLRYHFIVKEVA